MNIVFQDEKEIDITWFIDKFLTDLNSHSDPGGLSGKIISNVRVCCTLIHLPP